MLQSAPETASEFASPPLLHGFENAVLVAREMAESVDADGRFPQETFSAVRLSGILGVLAGPNPDLFTAAAHCQTLAAACGSSGMILAMHHIQVAALARHCDGSDWHSAFLSRVAEGNILLASSTSEVGIGGDLRTSRCFVEQDGARFKLSKEASAISYGEAADAILVTCRAHADAASSDQALVVALRQDTRLDPRERWDAMGMRGTSSAAYLLETEGDVAQIVPTPFHQIATTTMAPLSHILWASVWTGIAGEAVTRAHALLRSRRSGSEVPSGANLLAEAVETLQLAEARLLLAIERFDWNGTSAPSFAAVAEDNALKTSTSELCLKAAQMALTVAGFVGYARGGPHSVARHVRDLHSAPLMIANLRIREGAAKLLLAQRPRLGIKSRRPL